jgi:predicted nucleotidyltransferase
VNPIVEMHRDELEALCRRFGVRRLELFGSAAGDGFDSETSDLDFLVEFDPANAEGRADRYFGLLEALEGLFGRPVDVVELEAIRNPYFLKAIEPSRTVLHAA